MNWVKLHKYWAIVLTTILISGCGWADGFAVGVVYPWASVNKRMDERGSKEVPDQFDVVALPDGTHAFHSVQNADSNVAIIYLHGNGESVVDLADTGFLFWLDQLGVMWIAPDYPGMGIGGSGKPNETSVVNTAKLSRDWILPRLNPETRVFVWGRSMGAGVAAQLAHTMPNDLDGLILVSPWTSLRDVVQRNFIGKLFVSEKFHVEHFYNTAGVCTDIETPTLIVHGELDALIPVQMGVALSSCFRRSRLFLAPTFGHNDIYGGDALETIVDFLNVGR